MHDEFDEFDEILFDAMRWLNTGRLESGQAAHSFLVDIHRSRSFEYSHGVISTLVSLLTAFSNRNDQARATFLEMHQYLYEISEIPSHRHALEDIGRFVISEAKTEAGRTKARMKLFQAISENPLWIMHMTSKLLGAVEFNIEQATSSYAATAIRKLDSSAFR